MFEFVESIKITSIKITSIKSISIKPISAVCSALALSVLAGCAPMAVKDIAADKPAYMRENFSPKQLTDDVHKLIFTQGQRTLHFRMIKIKFKHTVENNIGDKKTSDSSLITYRNMGHGLVQQLQEYASNDIPFSTTFSLNYLGLISLRSQQVVNTQRQGNYIVETKHFDHFDKSVMPMRENADFAFDFTSGLSVQLGNFSDRKMTCNTGKFYPASRLYQTLPGNALDLDCEFATNGAVYLKQKLAYLQQYGLVIFMGYTNNAGKGAATIASVEVQ
jgi:hypothetical protein